MQELGIASAVRAVKVGRPSVRVSLVIALALAVLFTRVAGPLVLTPLVICCALVALTPIDWLNERLWAVVAWTAVAVMLPIFLEWFHVLPGTWSIRDGAMMIQSDVFQTHGTLEEVCLVFTYLVFLMIIAVFSLTVNRRRRRSHLP